jgi:hypothetical protein
LPDGRSLSRAILAAVAAVAAAGVGSILDPLSYGAVSVTLKDERWSEGMAAHQMYGGRAHDPIAARIGTLATSGDDAGIAGWREIAVRLDHLLSG